MENIIYKYLALILLGGLLLSVGYGIGYAKAEADESLWLLRVGLRLIDLDKLNISISEDMLIARIFQNKNNINGCLFLD